MTTTLTDRIADAVLHAAGDAILFADRDGIIRFWNAGAARIFGFTAAEAVGQSLDLIIPERLRARHNEGYARVMASGVSRYGAGALLAVPALTKTGQQISVEFTIVVVRDRDGAVEGLAAILRDVTPRFAELRALKRRLADLPEAAS